MSGITDVSFNQLEGEDIVIHPVSRDSVTPAGYDLRAGLVGVLSEGAVETKENSEGMLVHIIPPHTSAYIRTKEYVWLSSRVIATIHARGSLAAKGLFLNSTTVDPNWRGQMTCLLHNINDYEVEIASGMSFATMVMSLVDQPTQRGPDTNPQRVTQMYLERYGEEFSKVVAAYRNSDEASRLSNKFNEMVATAREGGIGERISESLRSAMSKVRESGGENVQTAVRVFVGLSASALIVLAIFPSLLIEPETTEISSSAILYSRLALAGSGVAILERLAGR